MGDIQITGPEQWGRHDFRDGEDRAWCVGACHFRIGRRPGEWLVRQWEAEQALEERSENGMPSGEMGGGGSFRFVNSRDSDALLVTPVAADRSVVARPEIALDVATGATLTLYVGSPLWIRIAEASNGNVLLEFPARRPSDTWFGPSPMVGELAYSTRTAARLGLENLSPRSDRLITRVELTNRAGTNLHIERILLPAPSLSVFVDEHERLWTEGVAMNVGDAASEADVKPDRGRSSEQSGWTLLSEPRREASDNILVRALSALRI